MQAEPPVTAPCDHLSSNLAALSQQAPHLAERIRRVRVPSTVESVIGRDGTPTYRILDDGGEQHYLGHTSMPTVRALALVETFGIDGHNAVVPSYGQGAEAIAILERMPPHGAVFAYEPDELRLRLALAVRDVSSELSTGRLVLLDGEDLYKAFVTFFQDHPGYEFPKRILTPPHLKHAEIEALSSHVQRAAERVVAVQRDAIASSLASLSSRPIDRPLRCVGVLTVDPRREVSDVACRIRSVAQRAGIRVAISTPDRPDRCHPSSRIAMLASENADAALLINCGWSSLQDVIPAEFPAASWLLPNTRLLTGMTDGFSARHKVFGATPALVRAAIDSGLDEDRVELLETASDETVFEPVDQAELRSLGLCFDVAVVGDVVDLQAGACGIQLESHLRLWNDVVRIGGERLEDSAENILSAAEQASGVILTEPKLRSSFLTLVTGRLLPTLRTRSVAVSLLALGFDVHVFGSGWVSAGVPDGRVHTFPADPVEQNALYQAASVVVCSHFDHRAAQTVLDAVVSGASVVFRHPQESIETIHPQLAEVLSNVPSYETCGACLSLVRSLLEDDQRRETACLDAHRIALAGHLMTHRFATIHASLANGCPPS